MAAVTRAEGAGDPGGRTAPLVEIPAGALHPRAQALVDRFREEGRVTLRTSLRSVSAILAIVLAFVLFALSPIMMGRPEALAVTFGVFGAPLLGTLVWVLWLLLPRDRVRIDASGITVRRRATVRWEWIVDLDVWVARSRATYSYVALALVDDASAGRRLGRARIETLPYMLAPRAALQAQALAAILTERRRSSRP